MPAQMEVPIQMPVTRSRSGLGEPIAEAGVPSASDACSTPAGYASAARLACSCTPDLVRLQHPRSSQIGVAFKDIYKLENEMRWDAIGRINTQDG
jgi:hypothetical protein